jgi:hypothetical protein
MKEKIAAAKLIQLITSGILLKVTEALEIRLQNELPGEQNHSCSSLRSGTL